MQKLSMEIVERMCQFKLTSCEIGFLLGISRYQNESGEVRGVYYKDIVKEMGFSIPQFYAAKKSLQEKGFIYCEKNNYYDHDIVILGNNYEKIYDFKTKPYINTRHTIFYSQLFHKLKPGAKLLAIFLTRIISANGFGKIGTKNFFIKYKEILGVKDRIIRTYITQLKEFFSIGIKKGNYYIHPKKDKVIYKESKLEKTEKDHYFEHEVEKTCRRNNIEIKEKKDVEDVRELVTQYEKISLNNGKVMQEVISDSIRYSVTPNENIYSSEKVLKPKLVHILVRCILNLNENKKTKNSAFNTPESQQKIHKNKFSNFDQRSYDFNVLEKALAMVN